MPIESWDELDPATLDGAGLVREYTACLAEIVRAVDAETLERELEDPSTLERIRDGNGDAIAIEDASAILAIASEHLDATGIRAELLDRLLIAMSNAVLDVDTLGREVEIDLPSKELQQRMEGRAPMTIAEYAHIRHAIARRNQ